MWSVLQYNEECPRGDNDLPGGLGKLEHGADAVPVVAPAVHAAGIFGLPSGPDLVQASQGGLFVRGVVDRLQVVGEGLFVLVRHIFQRIAHHIERCTAGILPRDMPPLWLP